jgi:hypothetical protein
LGFKSDTGVSSTKTNNLLYALVGTEGFSKMETGNLVRSKIRKEGYLEMLQRRIGK